jgi:nitrogen regulatory protein P-II 1
MRQFSQTGPSALVFSILTQLIAMKKIEAIIKPSKMESVRNALADLGINGVTITEVAASARRNGVSEFGPAGKYHPEFQPRIRLEIVVGDAMSGPVTSAIVEAAKTGSVSDGHIFVSQVEEAIRVRTRETAELALY